MDSVACRASRPMAVLLLLCFCSGVTASEDQTINDAPNCDALTQEITELKKENARLTAHIHNLMREKTPTPPPVKSCPGGWKTFGDRCYYRTEDKTWQEGRDYCQSQGADLVVINSPEEQAFIRGLRTEGYCCSWIGLTRSGDRWTWVDGTPLTTTYWYRGNHGNDEAWNCAYYYHHTDPGTWYNEECSSRQHAICEK